MWNRGAPGWAVQNRTVFHKNLTVCLTETAVQNGSAQVLLFYYFIFGYRVVLLFYFTMRSVLG